MHRTLLIRLLALGLCIGTGIASWVFISSLSPTLEKEPLTLKVDLLAIPPDSYKEVEWRNAPVIIFRPGPRTQKELALLNGKAARPQIQENLFPPAFAYLRISTYLGVGLSYSNQYAHQYEGAHVWVDSYHSGIWDIAGRRLSGTDRFNQPLRNLDIPPHRYTDNNRYIELL